MWTFFALISAIFSAGAAIGEKKALQSLTPLPFSFSLSIFNLCLSLPFLLLFPPREFLNPAMLILFGKSLLGAASFLLVMSGLRRTDISASLPLLILTPGLTAAAAWILLGEHLIFREITGLIFLAAGTLALQSDLTFRWKSALRKTLSHRGYLYIGLALLFFTVTSLLDKVIVADYGLPPEAFIFYQHLFLCIHFGAISLIAFRRKKPAQPSRFREILPLILLISIFTVTYRYTQILAVRTGPVALVLALKRLSVLIAAAAGGRLFREQNLGRHLTAAILMTAGAILIVL